MPGGFRCPAPPFYAHGVVTAMAKREVATVEPKDAAVPSTAPVVTQIMELASRKDINPEMFDRLVAWQEREVARQAEIAYNTAMNAAQAEVQPVARTSENSQTKSFYAKLEAVDAAIRPIYLKHGFSLEYDTVAPIVAGAIRVSCRCSHRDGHSRMFYREAPVDMLGPKGSAVKTALHGGGSTETYLKRYIATGIFNVVFKKDDDGVLGGMRFITTDQVAELESLIKESGREEARFLQLMGVARLDNIEAGAWAAARNVLLSTVKRTQAPREEGS